MNKYYIGRRVTIYYVRHVYNTPTRSVFSRYSVRRIEHRQFFAARNVSMTTSRRLVTTQGIGRSILWASGRRSPFRGRKSKLKSSQFDVGLKTVIQRFHLFVFNWKKIEKQSEIQK